MTGFVDGGLWALLRYTPGFNISLVLDYKSSFGELFTLIYLTSKKYSRLSTYGEVHVDQQLDSF